jgi:S-adenosylmethionine:tRNA ribosyltransferase-isomerase
MMNDPRSIHIQDYDYDLPAELIAQYPLETRDTSRLLVCKNNSLSEAPFIELPSLLPNNTFLVFNNTRVIRARFIFYKASGARIEIFCLEPDNPTNDLQQAFASTNESHWKCYIGNLKKWKEDVLQLDLAAPAKTLKVWAKKTGSEKDTVNVQFTWNDPSLSFSEVMETAGHIPLPPYINRTDEDSDATRYQTIFASQQGSVAAPTAGLHFTENIMKSLKAHDVSFDWVTLHVGAGTFKPVSSQNIGGHEMHYEHYTVSRDLILNLIRRQNDPVIPVGTTSMRTLESLYWLGARINSQGSQARLITEQWEPYEDTHCSLDTALKALLNFMDECGINTLQASTGLLIAPGYQFRLCKGLITNFHLPKSTLLLLVAALVGPDWKTAYQYALQRGFRFLSYGDSCLFLP